MKIIIISVFILFLTTAMSLAQSPVHKSTAQNRQTELQKDSVKQQPVNRNLAPESEVVSPTFRFQPADSTGKSVRSVPQQEVISPNIRVRPRNEQPIQK
jgi:hypothetical protein